MIIRALQFPAFAVDHIEIVSKLLYKTVGIGPVTILFASKGAGPGIKEIGWPYILTYRTDSCFR